MNYKKDDTPKTCQLSHFLWQKPCDREIWSADEQMCIFHCQQKSVNQFKDHFLNELSLNNENDDEATFNGLAFLFPRGLELNKIVFKKDVNFDFAQFGDNISLAGTSFCGDSSFKAALFGKRIDFDSVTFRGQVSFEGAGFESEANFRKARFKDAADFTATTMEFGASFSGTEFGGEASFRNTEFQAPLTFNYAQFYQRVAFLSAQFKNADESSFIDFTQVTFLQPGLARFYQIDLRFLALAQTNLKGVDFTDCIWTIAGKRRAVFDEIYALDTETRGDIVPPARLYEVEQIYLDLKNHLEDKGRYYYAEDFYIGSMEIRRKRLGWSSKSKTWRFLRRNFFSLEAWYRNVSYYGQRWERPLAWMALIFLSFSVLYLCSGFEHTTSSGSGVHVEHSRYDRVQFDSLSQFAKDYACALQISFSALTLQRSAEFKLTAVSQVIYVSESSLSAILLALLLLAIRRQFKR